MLGLSLSKILFTILVVIAVWRAYKMIAPWLSRMQDGGRPPARARPGSGARAEGRARPVDLIACPHCGTFVPRTTMCPDRDHCRLPGTGA